MGIASSRRVQSLNEAQSLGNPEESIYHAKGPRTNLYHGLTLLEASCFGTEYLHESGDTTFGYLFDFTRFETGFIIIIKYERYIPENSSQEIERFFASRNPLDEPMENQILNEQIGNMPFSYFNQHILPQLNLTSYITTIDFYTDAKGNPCIGRETQSSLEDIPYNTIPEGLKIPRVRLSELVAPETYRTHHPYIKVVLYLGNLYAYKFHGVVPMLSIGTTTYNDGLLQEVMELSTFDSPFILPPSFIITDRNNTGQFRGFLHPFMPAGSILDVFKAVHQVYMPDSKRRRFRTHNKKMPYDPRVSFLRNQRLEELLLTPEKLLISWSVKLSWALDMLSAIKVLHDADSFSGDFTLDNFLVDREGRVKMIDIAPVSGFTLYYASPELKENGDLALNGPRDIYNLGVVLWMLSEEIVHLRPESPYEIPGVTWSGGEDGAPDWYREVVYSCMQRKPQYRPTAAAILLILQEHLESTSGT